MSFEPSSPSTDVTNYVTFEGVAYSDIVEGSIYYEDEVSKPSQLYLFVTSSFLNFYRWK